MDSLALQVVDLSDDFPEKLIVKCAISEEGYVDYREFRDCVAEEGREAFLAAAEPAAP